MRMDEALEGLSGVRAIHDDSLIYGSGDTDDITFKDHEKNLAAFLQRCQERNIKLKKEKRILRMDKVTYLGHIITKDGLKLDTDRTRAITTCKADIKRFTIHNFVPKFAPCLSDITTPLVQLIKHDVEFVWKSDHEYGFHFMVEIL